MDRVEDSKKMKPGPKPMLQEEKKLNKTLTFSADVWDLAAKKAKAMNFMYRGRVSTAAYIEFLIEEDNKINKKPPDDGRQ